MTRRVVDDAVVEAIRQAPPEKTNTALGLEFGISKQYVGQIRRGRIVPKTAKHEPAKVEARLVEIAGDGGLTAKRAKATEMLYDNILLELEDLKLLERTENRAKRLSVISRALRDANDCADSLKTGGALEKASDADIMRALGLAPKN